MKPLPPGSTIDVTLAELRKLSIPELAKMAKKLGVDLKNVSPESTALLTALVSKAVN